tara:strand:- start:2441 stop:2932 length:492 start_codon:yes stop_codon:yes gene_type:complete
MKRDKYYLALEAKGHYDNLDKRSKDYREYKEWKALKGAKSYEELKDSVSKAPKGLGDSIAKVTSAVGLDKLVKTIIGEDCGCDERKEKLNKIFKYKKLECVTEEDFDYLLRFFKGNPSKVSHEQKVRLIGIYNFAFNQNESTSTSCSPCISRIVKNLKKYLVV